MRDIDSFWKCVRKKPIVKKFVKFIAHRFGIWECSEYVDFGYRMVQAKGLARLYYQIQHRRLGCRLRLEIPNFWRIGEGLILANGSSIVVHSEARIGRNCIIYKGVSIGSVRSGKRQGVPIIEDRVAIHANSVVVGGITVGHDTLIAANTFVDFDVPPHSVVIGNPATIHHKENASKDYIGLD